MSTALYHHWTFYLYCFYCFPFPVFSVVCGGTGSVDWQKLKKSKTDCRVKRKWEFWSRLLWTHCVKSLRSVTFSCAIALVTAGPSFCVACLVMFEISPELVAMGVLVNSINICLSLKKQAKQNDYVRSEMFLTFGQAMLFFGEKLKWQMTQY